MNVRILRSNSELFVGVSPAEMAPLASNDSVAATTKTMRFPVIELQNGFRAFGVVLSLSMRAPKVVLRTSSDCLTFRFNTQMLSVGSRTRHFLARTPRT